MRLNCAVNKERPISNVTANYSTREDGGVDVSNRGYSAAKGDWDEADGKAYFIGDPSVGRLKVSFFATLRYRCFGGRHRLGGKAQLRSPLGAY
jgi:lipocalin